MGRQVREIVSRLALGVLAAALLGAGGVCLVLGLWEPGVVLPAFGMILGGAAVVPFRVYERIFGYTADDWFW